MLLQGWLEEEWYNQFASDDDWSDGDVEEPDAPDAPAEGLADDHAAGAAPHVHVAGAGAPDAAPPPPHVNGGAPGAAAPLPPHAGGAAPDAAPHAPPVGGAAPDAAPGVAAPAPHDAPPVRPTLPKRPTGAWYASIGHHTLHKHTTITVLQASYALLKIKIDYSIHDTAFDIMLKATSAFLPKGHFLPGYATDLHCLCGFYILIFSKFLRLCSSWHLMKALVNVHSADEYCHHLCPNPACGHVFPDVARREWARAADHCCPECGSSRFKYVAGRLVPQKRCVACSCASCPL